VRGRACNGGNGEKRPCERFPNPAVEQQQQQEEEAEEEASRRRRRKKEKKKRKKMQVLE
jgi:hypothetical protein